MVMSIYLSFYLSFCLSICLSIFMHIHIYIYIYICVSARVCVCACVCVCVCDYVSLHVYMTIYRYCTLYIAIGVGTTRMVFQLFPNPNLYVTGYPDSTTITVAKRGGLWENRCRYCSSGFPLELSQHMITPYLRAQSQFTRLLPMATIAAICLG